VVAEVEAGEAIADVARRHRVQARTLPWWRWKLRTEGRQGPLLLPVVVRQPQSMSETASIELRVRDVVLRVASGADVTYVAALVAALRSEC
jgi:transposase-like protein